MTRWKASVGEILDFPADALICSANPQLNLSGGVGGAFALRFGNAMQHFLHEWLAANDLHFVEPGQVVVAPSCGSPFRVVIHAVAIDAFYDSSADIIRKAYANAFADAARAGCRTVASACLACGYGRATPHAFATAVRVFLHGQLPGIDRVDFISTNREVSDAVQLEIDMRNGK